LAVLAEWMMRRYRYLPVGGRSPFGTDETKAVRAAIGVTGQFASVDDLTGEENLRLMADLHHMRSGESKRVVEHLLSRSIWRSRRARWRRPTPRACAGNWIWR
jgi:ABC-type multidrug transport system ATPase subunit